MTISNLQHITPPSWWDKWKICGVDPKDVNCVLGISAIRDIVIRLGVHVDGRNEVVSWPEDTIERCHIILELFAANQWVQARYKFSPEIKASMEACEHHPKFLSEKISSYQKEKNKLEYDLKLAETQRLDEDDIVFKHIRFSYWPYVILGALALKFGKAVATMQERQLSRRAQAPHA